jgi:NADPH:quinone reductase-like Zn-dependent oxidoreductase
MKAMVNREYGPPDVLKLEEVPKPSPGDDEVLVKVRAASINSYDWRMLRAVPFMIRLMSGFLRPKNQILGADISGQVEAVGKNVTLFQPGDEVFGDVSESGVGGYAEYVCTLENYLAIKPADIPFEEASAVPLAALTALQGLRDHGRIQPGQKVLINGASGGVGTFALQLAVSFGAKVTAVCSTKNLEKARSLGAEHVIDYTKEDFTKNGKQYDLIYAVNGYHSITDYKRALAPGGTYVMAGGTNAQMFQAMLLGPWRSMFGSKKIRTYTMSPNRQDLLFLKELLEAGKIKPVIDRRYPLSELPEAFRYFENEHAQGKVVVTV